MFSAFGTKQTSHAKGIIIRNNPFHCDVDRATHRFSQCPQSVTTRFFQCGLRLDLQRPDATFQLDKPFCPSVMNFTFRARWLSNIWGIVPLVGYLSIKILSFKSDPCRNKIIFFKINSALFFVKDY